MSEHPLISLYSQNDCYEKSSLVANHPLILIVGREPSNTGKFNNDIGPYDFAWATHCAFWNESYAVISKIAGMNGSQQLKNHCRRRNQSPIAFTDISPVLIDNRDPLKHKKREAITESQIYTHIDNVVSLNRDINRTTVVLLSGHRSISLSKQEKRIFDIGATKLEEALTQQGIPHLSVPFMYGTNQREILDTIRDNDIVSSLIEDTVQAAA